MHIEALIEGIRWNTFVYDAKIKLFTDEQLRYKPENSNCPWWLLGHVVAHRPMMANVIGHEVEQFSYEPSFGYGSTGEYSEDWTSVETLLKDLHTTDEMLCEALSNAPEDKLAEKMKYIGGGKEVTRLSNFVFMFWHESYHSGQLAMISRMIGHDRFA